MKRTALVVLSHVCDDLSDRVGADVVLHGCPQSCMPNPAKGLPEVYEDMVEVLLVLEIFIDRVEVLLVLEIFLSENA